MAYRKTFEIKITGEGTKNQIESALRVVLNNIWRSTDEELAERPVNVWEDPTLITEISEN